jgi:NitT/TauT family transport system permease protein
MSVTDDRTSPAAAGATPAPEEHSAPPRPAKQSRWKHALAVTLPPILLGIVILGIWYFISYVMLSDRRRFLLRPPHQVVRVGFLDWDNFHTILESL